MTKSSGSNNKRVSRGPSRHHDSNSATSSFPTHQFAPSTINSSPQYQLSPSINEYQKQLLRVQEENQRQLRDWGAQESKSKRGSDSSVSGKAVEYGNMQATNTEGAVSWSSVRECLDSFITVPPKEDTWVGSGGGSEVGDRKSRAKEKGNRR